jgi:hypothetical protein
MEIKINSCSPRSDRSQILPQAQSQAIDYHQTINNKKQQHANQ